MDLALVGGLCLIFIRYLRSTRARPALIGLGLLGAVYFVVRVLELRLSTALFQAFFAVAVLILVVVFQEDLRRLFEQLGTLRRGRPQARQENESMDVLVRTVARLASTRTGALIVLPGQEPLDRHVEGGVTLGGRVSEPLLLSIFDTSSPGHDGAVIIRDGKIDRFAVHLPLSADREALGPGGTRHAAALGLAERCDATCIAVSEERGTVSLGRDGVLRTLARPEDLVGELRDVLPAGAKAQRWWQGSTGLDFGLAALAAIALWILFVPGSDMGEITVVAEIEVTNLPANLVLTDIEPASVAVTLGGLRRDLLLTERDEVTVTIDAYLARLGRRTFKISDQDVRTPQNLGVVAIEPEKIRLSFESTGGPSSDDSGDEAAP